MKAYAIVFTALAIFAGCGSNPSSSVNTTTGISYAPSVVWTDPWPGSVGPNIMSPNNVVIIRFSTLMDTRSVIHAVTISPTDQSVYIDTNRAAPVEGTTFDFPLTPTLIWITAWADARLDSRFPPAYQIYYPYFKVGQLYTVTIGATASDIYGDTLGTPVSFGFTPEPYFRVTNSYPMDGDTGISPLYPDVVVRFNAQIDTGSVAAAFAISPSVTGNGNLFSDTWGFYWYPQADINLGSETRYTVTIAASMKDQNGDLLHSPRSFSFTTQPYAVMSASPTGTGVSMTSAIYAYCNFLIDSTTIAPSLSVNPAVSGIVTYSGSSFTFDPSVSLAANTVYTVTISTGLRAKNGTAIKSPFTFSFTTGSQ